MKKNKIVASLICLMFVTALALAQDAAPAAAPAAAAPEAAPAAAAPATPAVDAAKAPAAAPAAPTMMPLELRKTGVVSVTKDASGKVTAIKLIVTSYDIQLDEGSKPLEAMDGQKVRVTCTLSHEGGKRILTVKSVEPVTEGSATAPGAVSAPVVAPAAAAPAAEKPAEVPAAK